MLTPEHKGRIQAYQGILQAIKADLRVIYGGPRVEGGEDTHTAEDGLDEAFSLIDDAIAHLGNATTGQ